MVEKLNCINIVESFKFFISKLNWFYRVVLIITLLWFVFLSILANTAGIFIYILVLHVIITFALRKKPKFAGYFTLALLITSITAVIIYYAQIYITGSSVVFKDTNYYVALINDLVKNYRSEYLFTNHNVAELYRFVTIRIPQTGFIYLVGTLTKIFCGHTNILFYMTVVSSIAALIVLLTTKIAEISTGNEKVVKASFFTVLLYPHFLLFSGVILKDILSILLILCIAYNIITINKNTVIKYISTTLLLAFMLFIRYRVGIAMISISIFLFIFPKDEPLSFKNIGKYAVKRWYIVLIFILVTFALYMFCYNGASEISAALVDDIPQPDTIEGENAGGVLRQIVEAKGSASEGDSALASMGFLDILYKIPPVVRQIFVLFYVILYPFNFYSVWSTSTDNLVQNVFMDLGTIFWLICLPFFIVGVYTTIKRKYNNQVIYIIPAIAAIMALVLYIHIRWKLMIWPFVAITIAVGIVHRKEHKKLLIVSVVCTVILAASYLLLSVFLG